jgi:AMP phosphorylase
MEQQEIALDAIRKKLVGKTLTYKEIYAIMDEIAHERLNDVLTTYFAASGYSKGFTDEEIYFLTKAMIETGDHLEFKGIVADKHSIGGVPGTRTTMIVVPIVAAAGFLIPKSSSRAITTPGGTADDMEVLAPVTFSKARIYKIVEKAHGCIVWGGGVSIAPADDILIQVEEPLMFESFDKILVSIMAKKVAFGANHVVFDLPYGESVKLNSLKDAKILERKFKFLAKKFDMKIHCMIHKTDEPFGKGIGPVLETRDALRVLQQKDNRPLDLEVKALSLAGPLLDLCLASSPHTLRETVKKEFGNSHGWATSILHSGEAFEKMRAIIKAQGGDDNVDSEDLKPGKYEHRVLAGKNGKVRKIHSKNASILAKILGAPKLKKSGIYLEKKIGDHVKKGDLLYSLFSEREYNLKEAKSSIGHFPITFYD